LDAKQHAHEYVADGGSALREPAAAAYAPVEHVGPVRLMRLRFAHQRLRATVRQVGKKLRPSLRVVVVRGLALLLVRSYLRWRGAMARGPGVYPCVYRAKLIAQLRRVWGVHLARVNARLKLARVHSAQGRGLPTVGPV